MIMFGNIIDVLGLNKKTFRAPDKMIVGDLSTQRLPSQVDCRINCVLYSIYLLSYCSCLVTSVHIINCRCKQKNETH